MNLSKIPKSLYLVLIILVVITGIILFSENQAPANNKGGTSTTTNAPSSTSTERASEIDTSGWETYQNEEFGFEVQYPPELIGFERTYANIALGGINFESPTQSPSCPSESYIFNGRRFFVQFTPDPCKPPEGPTQEIQKDIGGVTFTRSEVKVPESVIYTGKHEDVCYRLEFFSCPGQAESSTDMEIQRFEQIVSTFKLLK